MPTVWSYDQRGEMVWYWRVVWGGVYSVNGCSIAVRLGKMIEIMDEPAMESEDEDA